MAWVHRAACQDEDPEIFFPAGSAGPAMRELAAAKAVCNRCPVQEQCLRWALDSGQGFGTWGGLSEEELGAARLRGTVNAPAENPSDRVPKDHQED